MPCSEDDQALTLEDGQGVADGHPGYAVVLDQLGFGGQLVALVESALVDGLAQLVGDLAEDRTVAGGVQISEDAGGESGARVLLWISRRVGRVLLLRWRA